MKRLIRSFVLLALAAICLSTLQAADDPPAPVMEEKVAPSLAGFLGFSSNLVINPKVITPTDGNGTTFGLDYHYGRRVLTLLQAGRTDVDFSVHSEGLVVVEAEKSPHRLLTHGLRLSLVDLWPSERLRTPASDAQRALFRSVKDTYVQPWEELAGELKKAKTSGQKDSIRAEMDDLLGKAQAELAAYGTLEGDTATRKLYLSGHGNTPRQEWEEVFLKQLIKPRFVFLSLDLDGNAETDQNFQDVQLVGQAQLRGKVLMDWLDAPFALLRGSRQAVSHLNRNGGPYFWGGVAIVDPSSAETRQALVGNDDAFGRAQFGVSFRTEVFSGSSPSKCVALELSWRYYHEFNAPAAIRNNQLDHTSYFKATLLFPGNYFLEYTDGKLPLDVESSSTVSVGWRYNF